MNPGRAIEYMTGFMMGSVAGVALDGVLVGLYNLLARWFGWLPLHPAWWCWLPLPLVCGLFMAKGIADLHLEDYG